jgi:hypothetical protein
MSLPSSHEKKNMVLNIKLFLFLLQLIKVKNLFVIMVCQKSKSKSKSGPPTRRQDSPTFVHSSHCYIVARFGHI